MTREQAFQRRVETALNELGITMWDNSVDPEGGGTPDLSREIKFRRPNFDENGEPDF